MPITPSQKIWMDGTLVDWDEAKVHVLTHTLHYGAGVFEGVRAYETPKGTGVFRLKEHVHRLFDSAKIFHIQIPYSEEEVCEAIRETVRVNGLPECYIRPLVYLGYGEMGLNPLPCPVNVTVAVWPWGAYLGEDGVNHGVRTKISSWTRHNPNSMPPAAKGTGMYINSQLAKVEAILAGYDEAIMLSPQGYISECTGENIFIVQDGAIRTPPVASGALQGVTQDTVLSLAADLGIPVQVENLLRSCVYTCDEAFCTGTAAEVTPIRSVDDRVIGEPGPITRAIQKAYADVVHGRNAKYEHWIDLV